MALSPERFHTKLRHGHIPMDDFSALSSLIPICIANPSKQSRKMSHWTPAERCTKGRSRTVLYYKLAFRYLYVDRKKNRGGWSVVFRWQVVGAQVLLVTWMYHPRGSLLLQMRIRMCPWCELWCKRQVYQRSGRVILRHNRRCRLAHWY